MPEQQPNPSPFPNEPRDEMDKAQTGPNKTEDQLRGEYITEGEKQCDGMLRGFKSYKRQPENENASFGSWARAKHSKLTLNSLAGALFLARVSPIYIESLRELFTEADLKELRMYLYNRVHKNKSEGTLPYVNIHKENFHGSFAKDKAWIDEVDEYLGRDVFRPRPRSRSGFEQTWSRGSTPPFRDEQAPAAEADAREETAKPQEGAEEPSAVESTPRNLKTILAEGLKTGFKRWWENVDPRKVIQHFKEKDWIWLAGFGVGVGETAVVAVLPLGLDSYVKAGINFAVIASAHLSINIARGAMEAQARKQFEGEEFNTRQEQIAKRFGEGHKRIKEFGLGLSAGVTYTSLGIGLGGAFEAGSNFLSGSEGTPITTEVSAPTTETITPPTEAAAQTLTPTPTEAAVGVAAVPEQAALIQERITQLSNNADWQEQVSAEVGQQLKITDQIIDSSLHNMGKSLSDLDPVSLEKARMAVQHALEAKANSSFSQAMDTVVSTDPFNAGLDSAVEAGQNAFRESLSNDETLKSLVALSQKALEDQLRVEDVMAGHVTSELNLEPDLFVDTVINHGTSVGNILQQSGYHLSWGSQDANIFGSHIAANYDLLTNMWDKMASAKLIPDAPFPVSMTELSDLVAKAEAGDVLALKKLKNALHWIPAGSTFRVLNEAVLTKALGLIK